MTAHLEKIAAAGIQLIPAELSSHFIFERDGFVALVERKEDGFGNIGSAGLMTDHGLAVLMWRGAKAFFITRGFEQEATGDQVERLRSFAADLQNALM